jgi:nitrogen fixation/metabolism regulation signal transduction histidine kinase
MLTAINGYSELLLRDLKEDTSIRQKVLEIKKAGERSASLTQQLLAFSRRQVLKPQMLDVNNVITDMESLLRRLIGEHIYLNINLSEDKCRVEADPGQLSQVIMNLAVNARDAMAKGGDLTIKTENMYLDEEYAAAHVPTIPGDYVLLSVSDTGVGVGEEARKHIFEPFYTTKEKGAGTGLGLATVYGIVKQSGGYIWVDSEPGKGATFMVFLPQVKKVVTISKEKIRYEAEMPGSETILLVEDEESVRELTVKILEMNGYSVIEAEDGVEALEIYKSGVYKIDLLITDVVMPRMSGRELTEKVKELNPDIRVLFSSGYSDDRDMMRDADSKTIDFINKPFTSEELSRKIRYLLDKPVENNKTDDVENLLKK